MSISAFAENRRVQNSFRARAKRRANVATFAMSFSGIICFVASQYTVIAALMVSGAQSADVAATDSHAALIGGIVFVISAALALVASLYVER